MNTSTHSLLLVPLVALAFAACGDSVDNETQGTQGAGGATTSGATTSGDTSSSASGGTGGSCAAEHFLDLSNAPGAGDGYPAPTLTATCTEDSLVIEGNGIPPYEFVPITPNALVAQDHHYELPRYPAVAAQPTDVPLLGFIGVAVNGLPFFGPNEGPQPAAEAYGDPIYNAIMDGCQGHTANEYHYHALLVKCLLQANLKAQPWTLEDPAADAPSPVIGFAADGFPIYGPSECTDQGCTSVVEMLSGWDRVGDPKMNAWDAYVYSDKGDAVHLDKCNGHVGPGGDYHYHATSGFPYILGCYAGTPADIGGGAGVGAGAGAGGGMNPGDCAPGQTQMCCGDGVCDGPETAQTCPADC